MKLEGQCDKPSLSTQLLDQLNANLSWDDLEEIIPNSAQEAQWNHSSDWIQAHAMHIGVVLTAYLVTYMPLFSAIPKFRFAVPLIMATSSVTIPSIVSTFQLHIISFRLQGSFHTKYFGIMAQASANSNMQTLVQKHPLQKLTSPSRGVSAFLHVSIMNCSVSSYALSSPSNHNALCIDTGPSKLCLFFPLVSHNPIRTRFKINMLTRQAFNESKSCVSHSPFFIP